MRINVRVILEALKKSYLWRPCVLSLSLTGIKGWQHRYWKGDNKKSCVGHKLTLKRRYAIQLNLLISPLPDTKVSNILLALDMVEHWETIIYIKGHLSLQLTKVECSDSSHSCSPFQKSLRFISVLLLSCCIELHTCEDTVN